MTNATTTDPALQIEELIAIVDKLEHETMPTLLDLLSRAGALMTDLELIRMTQPESTGSLAAVDAFNEQTGIGRLTELVRQLHDASDLDSMLGEQYWTARNGAPEQRVAAPRLEEDAVVDEVRARQLVIVDNDGRERIYLGVARNGTAEVVVYHPTIVGSSVNLQVGDDDDGRPVASVIVFGDEMTR